MRRPSVRLLVVAALLAFPAGAARAAAPPAGTIGPANPSVGWTGQPYADASVSDPGLCPPQALDPGNVVCDHFSLSVDTPGTVDVSIGWPSAADDFDLYVCRDDVVEAPSRGCPGGTLVASSTNAGGTSEAVTFAAGAVTYDVRVVPVFVVDSGYDGTASFLSTSPGGGGTAGGGLLSVEVGLPLNVRLALNIG